MIFKIEIDTFTTAGHKVHEFIENLEDKRGITYLTKDDCLSEEEFKLLELRTIKKINEKIKQSHLHLSKV